MIVKTLSTPPLPEFWPYPQSHKHKKQPSHLVYYNSEYNTTTVKLPAILTRPVPIAVMLFEYSAYFLKASDAHLPAALMRASCSPLNAADVAAPILKLWPLKGGGVKHSNNHSPNIITYHLQYISHLYDGRNATVML